MSGEILHSILIQNRETAEITGILDVESYQEMGILLNSAQGEIAIDGSELKIESFSVESGRICITGRISGLYYNNQEKKRGGLFSRSIH